VLSLMINVYFRDGESSSPLYADTAAIERQLYVHPEGEMTGAHGTSPSAETRAEAG
jgi:hypothetical protein